MGQILINFWLGYIFYSKLIFLGNSMALNSKKYFYLIWNKIPLGTMTFLVFLVFFKDFGYFRLRKILVLTNSMVLKFHKLINNWNLWPNLWPLNYQKEIYSQTKENKNLLRIMIENPFWYSCSGNMFWIFLIKADNTDDQETKEKSLTFRDLFCVLRAIKLKSRLISKKKHRIWLKKYLNFF